MASRIPTWMPILLVGYLVLGFAFRFKGAAATKRRWWTVYIIGFGALFLLFMAFAGARTPQFTIALPFVALITWMNHRSMQICDRCGRTVTRPFFYGRAKVCLDCGARFGA